MMYEVKIFNGRGVITTTAYGEVELRRILEDYKNCEVTFRAFFYDDVTGERQYY